IRGKESALGLLEKLPDRGLAIVGTRHPLPRTLDLVRRSVAELEGSGLIILSGLALGIDAAAHEAALEAGLRTIAFLACGIDRVYPRWHQELADRILEEGGLIVSEYPAGEQAFAGRFLDRNRLIASWARATWIA